MFSCLPLLDVHDYFVVVQIYKQVLGHQVKISKLFWRFIIYKQSLILYDELNIILFQAPDRETVVKEHFIAFTEVDGNLYELGEK